MMRAWLAARARRRPSGLPLGAWSGVTHGTPASAYASLAEPDQQQTQQQQQHQAQPHQAQPPRPQRQPSPAPRRRSAPPAVAAAAAAALAGARASLPAHVLAILRRLRGQGHEAWLAGGAVRDLLLRAEPRDYDVLTSAALEEVVVAFGDDRLAAGGGGGGGGAAAAGARDVDGGGDSTSGGSSGGRCGDRPPAPSWARVVGARHPVALVRTWPGAPLVEVSSLRRHSTPAGAAAAAAAARPSPDGEDGEAALGQWRPSLQSRRAFALPPPPSQLLTRPGVVAAAASAPLPAGTPTTPLASQPPPPLPPPPPTPPPPVRLASAFPRPWALGELAAARRASALSRDFTANSLLLDVFTGTLLDYTGRGVSDLLQQPQQRGGGGAPAAAAAGAGAAPAAAAAAAALPRGVLRCVLDPPSRSFDEDPARVLRGVRCASRARLALDPQTERAMRLAAPAVPSRVGPRRLAHELSAMLSFGGAADAARLLWRVGLLGALLPLHAAHAERRRRRRRLLEEEEQEAADEEEGRGGDAATEREPEGGAAGEAAAASGRERGRRRRLKAWPRTLDDAGGDALLSALSALDRRARPQSPAPPEAVLAALAAPLLAEALEEASDEVVRALQLARLRPQHRAWSSSSSPPSSSVSAAAAAAAADAAAAALPGLGGAAPSALLLPQTPAARELLWGRRPLRGVVLGAALDVVGALCRVGVGVGVGVGGQGAPSPSSSPPHLPPPDLGASAGGGGGLFGGRGHPQEAARLLHAHFVRCNEDDEDDEVRAGGGDEEDEEDEEEAPSDCGGDVGARPTQRRRRRPPANAAESLVHASLLEAGERLDQLTGAALALRALLGDSGAGAGGGGRGAGAEARRRIVAV